jgi:Nif-specific regulatory protein
MAMKRMSKGELKTWVERLKEREFALQTTRKGLAEFSNTLVSKALINGGPGLDSVLQFIMETSVKLVNAEVGRLFVVDESGKVLRHRLSVGTRGNGLRIRIGQGIIGWALETGRPLIANTPLIDAHFASTDEIPGLEIRSLLVVPLKIKDTLLGVAQLVNKIQGNFTEEDREFFTVYCNQIAIALQNAKLEELKKVKDLKERENIYLRGQLEQKVTVESIVGKSRKIKEVISTIKKISKAPYPVLIMGESGVGKELVAKAIYSESPRRDAPFVVLNCAAMPGELLESELFGYEKGAFTGASQRKLGLFEVANGGSIFLDEIADMSLQSQAKVLRVLQENEIQRLGGLEPIKVDVRVLAASNKCLKDQIEKGNFREDLFYRLNVVPINVPPLRERKEDIPILAQGFLERSCREMGKDIPGFSPDCMRLMQQYTWPGNIRELRNVIERLVTLASPEKMIEVKDLPSDVRNLNIIDKSKKYKLNGGLYAAQVQLEKEMIVEALKMAKGNKSKAAELLGINRKVLYDKIANYRISGTPSEGQDIEEIEEKPKRDVKRKLNI